MPRLQSVRRKLLSVGCAVILAGGAHAAQVNYGDQGNFILDPDLSLAEIGSLVRLGTFPVGFDFAANSTDFSATNNAFTEFDSTTIGAAPGSGAGQFYDTAIINGFANTQLYIWVLNNGIAAAADAWVIVTNPAWLVPVDPAGGMETVDFDTSDRGTIIPPGAQGFTAENLNSTNLVNFGMQPIPEPSTYALLAVGAAGLVALRRRKRRV